MYAGRVGFLEAAFALVLGAYSDDHGICGLDGSPRANTSGNPKP